ncbi:MAG: beta-glucosidase BglX [Candidatus Obscuribacterales bacterium]|nr:beta-glucosidase BglX [Candidatus Obscuribacterales bacterium]
MKSNWLPLLALALLPQLAASGHERSATVCETDSMAVSVRHTTSRVNTRKGSVAAASLTNNRDKFVSNLLSQMTLEDKIGQMNLLSVGFDVTGPIVNADVESKIRSGKVGGVFNTFTPSAVRKLQKLAVEQSTHKIPLLFGYDVIHGHRTIFPVPLALSASWDLDLIEKTARVAAAEASADGLNWVFSPMVDIARDPRWGRVCEGSGEDPYLGSCIAKAMVRGYQGDGYEQANNVMACAKHFALYGAAEGGRDYNTVDMSPVRMFNEYLPPYKAAVDAGVASLMSSFNEINGLPATGNKWLHTELLRNKWKFHGFVCSDYTGVNEMVRHGSGDEKEVTELALNAGIDMDMVGELFTKYGSQLVNDKKISEKTIDDACRRILQAKYDLGLFDDPYRFANDEKSNSEMLTPEKLELSKKAAVKSIVLLKNANDVLPLQRQQKVAFIGPLVKDKRNLIGSWSAAGDWKQAISLWEGVKTKYGANQFFYAKGCNLLEDKELIERLNRDGGMLTREEISAESLIAEAVSTARKADVVVAVLGEPFGMSGEAASRSMIGLFDNQVALLKALKSAGKPIVLVLLNGRPLTLKWEDENLDAILETWFGGTMHGAAVADVLFGEANPSGKLTMSFPVNEGQIPIYYSAKSTGRPFDADEKYRSRYLDVSNAPLYPFGFGLSYTNFTYADVITSSPVMTPTGNLTVSATVSNVGKRAGTETVQLYIRDLVGSITRPVNELKAFKQVELRPGESKKVEFSINKTDVSFYNSDLAYVAEPGEFVVSIGPNSMSLKSAKISLLR